MIITNVGEQAIAEAGEPRCTEHAEMPTSTSSSSELHRALEGLVAIRYFEIQQARLD